MDPQLEPTPPRTPDASRFAHRLPLFSVILGVLYGALARVVFGWKLAETVFGVMTAGFIFAVPFALGFLVVWLGERERPWGWGSRIIMPWVSSLLALGGALALAWEGLICIVLWVPLFMIMSSLGGILAGVLRLVLRSSRGGHGVLASFLILPFGLAPLEHRFPPPTEMHVVPTQIEIHASPATVWSHIKRVRRIEPGEHSFYWAHAIGFPRPVEATLSQEAVGGVRHATFEGDVLFLETVTAWEPERRLAFSIRADTDNIPATSLDEHVTVGGPFFDVLDGQYELEVLGPDRVMLHLSSTHRLSTRFNAYSGIWTDFIMRDVQDYILGIIKRRCEGGKI
jgi:hypothetical protein